MLQRLSLVRRVHIRILLIGKARPHGSATLWNRQSFSSDVLTAAACTAANAKGLHSAQVLMREEPTTALGLIRAGALQNAKLDVGIMICQDKLDWNETLIKSFVGREALWLHRRFLSMCWINSFPTVSGDESYHSKEATSMHHDFGTFLNNELCLLQASTFADEDYGDFQAQAMYSQVPKPLENDLPEKIREVDLKTLLDKSCPERSSLFSYFMSYRAIRRANTKSNTKRSSNDYNNVKGSMGCIGLLLIQMQWWQIWVNGRKANGFGCRSSRGN
ncbi:unnamed protein product [Trifolium pratense]|uniref:Uncharacterized protein n=1 Tax=Trifolium pratense TaxID=57577 RepID=A0ACB0JFA2_TRIPR|nr:unnamed protein product [Trifolium pratense]